MVNHQGMGTVRPSVVVKSISLGDGEMKTPARSISFSIKDSEAAVINSLESGKFTVEGTISIERRDSDMVISIKTTPLISREETNGPVASIVKECLHNLYPRSEEMTQASTIFNPSHPRNEAAVKLQKVYKSFRTRRKLADCAVLVEQRWWKLLDFAELKHSSISFFDGEKHETAISRWSRARTRAAKVGKGLSKNDKAQKLALQHWLEAIDPRHRYGHNLRFYYVKWLESQSREPFFYWLDIGEGKEVNLEKCPRLKLQQQCIKYLGPMERKAYEVVIEDGKLVYKQSGELLDTTGDAKWIFVLGTSKVMYVGKKKKGSFQHSSFLAGGAALAAGRLAVEHGVLKAAWPHSGHYRPTEENFKDFISFLSDNNVDLTDVKLTPVDDDGMSFVSRQASSSDLRIDLSELELTKKVNESEIVIHDSSQEKTDSTGSGSESPKLRRLESFSRKLANIQIPKQRELLEELEGENQRLVESDNLSPPESPVGDYETAEQFALEDNCTTLKPDVTNGEHEEGQLRITPPERISYKEPKTCQMGKQVTRKWTSGAGARINYVRDHPTELQVRALEQLNLSPRRASLRSSVLLGSSALSSESSQTASQQEAAISKSPPLGKRIIRIGS